MHVFKQLVYRM